MVNEFQQLIVENSMQTITTHFEKYVRIEINNKLLLSSACFQKSLPRENFFNSFSLLQIIKFILLSYFFLIRCVGCLLIFFADTRIFRTNHITSLNENVERDVF